MLQQPTPCNPVRFGSITNHVRRAVQQFAESKPQRARRGFEHQRPFSEMLACLRRLLHTDLFTSAHTTSFMVLIAQCSFDNLKLTILGPGSYLSICSDPAAEWVSKQIGPSGFSNSASTLATEVCRGLKIQAPTHQTRVPEPPLDCARRYAAGAIPCRCPWST